MHSDLGLLDALQIDCPAAKLAIYVDSVNIEATTEDCRVTETKNMTAADMRFLQACKLARIVATAINVIVTYFEDELGMEVSAPKSKITSSVPAVARFTQTLVKKNKATAISYKKGESAKMLGVGTNGGYSRVTKTLNKRTAALKKKIPRYQLFGRKGFSRQALAGATVVPAATYGCETVGYSDTALLQLRRTALGAIASDTGGGCMESEWLERDGSKGVLDPAFQAHIAPHLQPG